MNIAIRALICCTFVLCACGGAGSSVEPPPLPDNPCLTAGVAVLDGTVCGVNQACRTGACVACVEGAPCVPRPVTCNQGHLACGPTPTCVDTGAGAADGTVCGVQEVCSNASCAPCVEGEVCMTGGPCYSQSRMSCAHGPMCDQLTVFPDGTPCGGGTCQDGVCR
jgi:hypothetical protein